MVERLPTIKKTLQHLAAVHTILLQLERFQSSTGDLPQINAIRGQSQSIQHEVAQFLEKLEKYNATLGGRSRKGFHHGMLSKIKWSQHMIEKGRILRGSVETQLSSIHVLLGLYRNDATSKIYNEQLKVRNDIVRTTLRNARHIKYHNHDAKRARHSLRQAAASAQIETTNSIDALVERIKDLELAICNRHVAYSHDQITSATDQIAEDRDRLEQSNTAVASGLHESTATVRTLLQLKYMLALHLQSTRHAPAPVALPDEPARIKITLTLPKFDISAHDLKILLQRLSVEFEIVLGFFLASLFVCLKDLIWALPQTLIIRRILQRLPQTISLVVHDNMRFEDALGRVHSLQYQQFKHWTVFEANLRCAFMNSPA